MKQLRIVMLLFAAASIPAGAQTDSVTVEIDPVETCPTGWATVDTSWTKPALIFYTLPASLFDAYRQTHIRGTPEFQVTQTFVTAVWPTLTEQQAAYASGRLRSEPAASGTVRTCTLP